MSAALSLPDGLGPDDLDFAKQDGLLPGVVQDARTGQLLMLGYLDRAALEATLATGLATFWSRSRGTSWVKGETSGNILRVQDVGVDCDRDTLLLRCLPTGPTCHTGATSCFDAHDPAAADTSGAGPAAADTAVAADPMAGPGRSADFLAELDAVIGQRHADRPDGSYTTSLFEGGVRRIAQKVGEEGVETALAGVVQDDEALLGESADLLYHLLVLLRSRGLGLADVTEVLRTRHS